MEGILLNIFSINQIIKFMQWPIEQGPSSSNDIQWHEVDLTSGPQVNLLIKNIKPDILIQAAASTSGSNDIITNPSIHVTDNAVMNSYIFRSATEADVKHLIFFSCTVMPLGRKTH